MQIPDDAKKALIDISKGFDNLHRIIPGDGTYNCDYDIKFGIFWLKSYGYITTKYEINPIGLQFLSEINQ